MSQDNSRPVEDTILIIEDNDGLSELIREELRDQGWSSVGVRTGREAMAWLVDRRPALVLLDYSLPDMTGDDLLSAMAAMPPFIVMTGHGDERVAVTMMKHGARDYLVKDDQFLDHLPIAVANVLRQIQTERKLAEVENALRESEQRYRSLFKNMLEGFAYCRMLYDEQGFPMDFVYLDVNPAFEQLTGLKDVIGKKVTEVIPGIVGLSPELFESYGRVALTGKPETFEIDLKTLALSLSISVYSTTKGYFVAIFQNVTERKRAEEERLGLERQLQQARKAESLGRMAGAIAHHFNNLLGVVMGNLELATCDLAEGSALRENVAEAMTASKRAADISRLMLGYLGQSAGAMGPIELSQVCREALPLLRASLPQKVNLKIELPDPGPIIRGDAAQVRQVLTNLVVNAGEAVGDEEGDVTVTVSVVPAPYIRVSRFHPVDWEPTEQNYACIEVADTGCGMEPQTMEQLFEPFFSTRFIGRGLGLPVVLGTVKAHQGAATAESEPGRGSVFRVYLPLSAEQPRSSPKTEAVAPEPPQEPGLVLLVEDEPALRNLAKIMLGRLGWEVMTAVDGVEAVELFQQHQARIQCLLLDLTMPRMGGWETLAEVRAIRPDIPVVLASGYDEARVMAGDHPERPQAFLSKPYAMAQLQAALARGMMSDG
jgi:PAS domain S-box-containing protein